MDKIIACVDRELDLPTVCDHAVWAAHRLGGPLEFLHVLDRHPERTPRVDMTGSIGLGTQESLLDELSDLDARRSKLAQEHGRLVLESARARADETAALLPADAQPVRATGRQRHGALVDTLTDLEPEAQLFVMAQHHHAGDLAKRHLDHNLERVVRSVHRPLLVAAATFNAPRGYLVAFDGSPTGKAIVQAVATSHLLRGLAAHIVTVGTDSTATRQQLAWAAEIFRTSHGTPVTAVVSGEPETALAGYALNHGLDLLVMGAYGHSRIRHLIVGSTTTTILRTSPLAVLVMR
ncbi:MAG: universal stress protein [Kofleriaceae bacterium]